MPTKRSEIQMRSDKKNTRHYGFKMNLRTDADIVELLDSAPSKQTLIKAALREYIANHPEKPAE